MNHLQHPRYYDDYGILRLVHVLNYIFHALAERCAGSAVEYQQHSQCTFVRMMDRQDRQRLVPRMDVGDTAHVHDVDRDISVAEHHTLRGAGRSRCKQDYRHVVRIKLCIRECSVTLLQLSFALH